MPWIDSRQSSRSTARICCWAGGLPDCSIDVAVNDGRGGIALAGGYKQMGCTSALTPALSSEEGGGSSAVALKNPRLDLTDSQPLYASSWDIFNRVQIAISSA